MRIYVTGASGFVGSNIVTVALEAGHEVKATGHTWVPTAECAHWDYAAVDTADPTGVTDSVEAFGPDVVIHAAIWNDYAACYADRTGAWDAFVGATRRVADASAGAGAHFVLVSTDWVFDGTQTGADESTPPNPVNLYGVLKMASELVTLERGGAVARVSGVNGPHRARPAAPRAQDPGFGYFVASIVDALGSGRPFTVWEADDINMRASLSLASECGRVMLRIGEGRHVGVFHCCGRGATTRRELAVLTCDVFDLDADLLRFGPPDPPLQLPGSIPYDTSLSSPRTAGVLGYEAPDPRTLLTMFRNELEELAP